MVHSFSGTYDNQLSELFSKDPQKELKNIAVFPFRVDIGIDTAEALALSEYTIDFIKSKTEYELVSRTDFKSALQSICSHALNGCAPDEKIQLSKRLNIKKYLIGNLSSAFNRRYITLKLVECDSLNTLSSVSATFHPENIQALVQNYLIKSYPLAVTLMRSIILPGWGQYKSGHTTRGAISLGVFGTSLLATAITYIITAGKRSKYQEFGYVDPDNNYSGRGSFKRQFEDEIKECPQKSLEKCKQDKYGQLAQEKKALTSQMKDAYRWTYITLAITGTVWGANLIDAILANRRPIREKNLYFSFHPQRKLLELAFRF